MKLRIIFVYDRGSVFGGLGSFSDNTDNDEIILAWNVTERHCIELRVKLD